MKLLILFSLLFSPQIFSNESAKSLCGRDDRIQSFDRKVGRARAFLNAPGGCTITLISEDCAISAGHCFESFTHAEFNTPDSINGNVQTSAPEDIYPIDRNSLIYSNKGIGKDWAVMRLAPNPLTGKLPGVVQGYYSISNQTFFTDQPISITSYGRDFDDDHLSLAQQIGYGNIVRDASENKSEDENILYHNIDTMGGSSGASILTEDFQIIGIHTNAGCSAKKKNAGTLIQTSSKLIEAINSCLNSSTLE